MLKVRMSARRFWFMLVSVFFIATAAIAQQVKSDCAGAFTDVGPTATGGSMDLLDPSALLQVTSLPLISDNALFEVRLNIVNRMLTQERLADGFFSMLFSYAPAGGGNFTKVPATANVYCSELLYKNALPAKFTPTTAIPVDRWNSLKCILIFEGSVGSQPDMLVIKAFSPGDLMFNEEWDNGLTGNHAWTSSPPDINPDNGTSSKDVSSGKLTMTNLRQADTQIPPKRGHTNDLWVMLTDTHHPNGILITADSHIQFKIDEMTCTTTDSAEAAHILEFHFSSTAGPLSIQYGRPHLAMRNRVVQLSFTPGELMVDNIYTLLQDSGYSLPSPLHLTSIGYLQQVYPQSAEQSMRLTADAVRIVDQNVQ